MHQSFGHGIVSSSNRSNLAQGGLFKHTRSRRHGKSPLSPYRRPHDAYLRAALEYVETRRQTLKKVLVSARDGALVRHVETQGIAAGKTLYNFGDMDAQLRPFRTLHTLGSVLKAPFLAILTALLTGCASAPEPRLNLAPALAVLQHAAASRQPALRAHVMESVQPLERMAAIKILMRGMTDPSPMVRFTAAMVAGQRRLVRLEPQLQTLRRDSNLSVRPAAIYALARLGETKYLAALPAALENRAAIVRANAAMVLGDLGDVNAAHLLRQHVDDPNAAVRFAVTVALAQLGQRQAISSLIAMSLSAYAADQLAALSVFCSLRAPVAANVLTAGLSDTLPEARLIAARGLGRRGSAAGQGLALHYAHSRHSHLRALAALALGAIARPADAAVLRRMLADPNPQVRVAAAAGWIELIQKTTEK